MKKKVNLSILVVLLSLFIEESSFFDFFSDLIIIRGLGQSTDTAWFSFSLFTVLAPYYTVYTSLINIQIENHRSKTPESKSCLDFIGSSLLILPSMLIFLILIDVVYMCMSVIVYPILLPFSFFPIGQRMLDSYEEGQNWVLSRTLGLSHMEIQGFRS